MKFPSTLCLTLSLIALGCGNPEATKKGVAPNAKHDEHDHPEGPHGGTVFDLGKYHAEFKVDHAKQEATIYMLTQNMKKTEAVTADKLELAIKDPAFQVELKPMPMEGDPAGKCSRFVGKHEKFGKEQEFAGSVTGVIDGKPSQGEFKEEDHDHKKK